MGKNLFVENPKDKTISRWDTDDFKKAHFIQDFDKLLNDVKEEYEYMQSCRDKAYQELKEWNKDEEIQFARSEVLNIKKHSLLILTDKELEAINTFRKKHWHMGNNNFIYDIDYNEVAGHMITIKCPICGEVLDVTDKENW